MLDWQKDLSDPREFMETLRTDLFEEEVYVFTPKGEVKSLAAGATPLDFAYEVHTEIGHRCVGARVNGKIVPLHYELCSGDIVEILTAKRERGPSRDWLAMVKTTRARNKIKQWFKAESRQDTEHIGRDLLQEHLRKQGLPAQKITGSALLADVIREVGYRKADDFYIALGGAKVSPKVVVNKVMQRLKQGEAADGEASAVGPAAGRAPAAAPDEVLGPVRDQGGGRRGRHAAPGQVLPPGPRAMRSSATYRSAAASRSTARTAPTRCSCARPPSASRTSPGKATARRRSSLKSRSTPGIATACSRTSRACSRSPAPTSWKRAACRLRRWSRTASWSRWRIRTR